MLALLTGAGILLVNLLKVLYFYFFIYRKLDFTAVLKSVSNEDYETSYKHLFITGIQFFVVGLAAIVVWNTDNFIISNFLGFKELTPYAVSFKLYFVLFTIMFTINGSILPLMGKEFGNRNWQWINNVYNRFLIFAATIGGFSWLFGLAFLKDAVTLWAGKENYAGLWTVFAFGFYAYLLAMVNLNSAIISTFNYIKHSVYLAWGEALAKVLFSIVLIKYLGITGVAIGTVISSLMLATWILPIWIEKRSDHKIKYNLTFILKHFGLILVPIVCIEIFVQLFVSSMYMRLAFGSLAMILYAFLCYSLIPSDVKEYVKVNIINIKTKLLRYVPNMA
jgi:O-antigen/teichoic acid export membrane protein